MRESNVANTQSTAAALFYIMNIEMVKPSDQMNVSLVTDCAEAAIRLDPRLAPDGKKKEALKEKLRSACAVKPKKLSRTAKILIIAAALFVIAGITVYAAIMNEFAILDRFIHKPEDIFEYEEGEAYTQGNAEFSIKNTEETRFRSLDALLADLGRDVEIVNDETGKIVFTEAVKTHKDGKTRDVSLYYRCGDTPVSLSISFDEKNPITYKTRP